MYSGRGPPGPLGTMQRGAARSARGGQPRAYPEAKEAPLRILSSIGSNALVARLLVTWLVATSI